MQKPLVSTILLLYLPFFLYAQSDLPPKIMGILPLKVVENRQIEVAKQLEALVYEVVVGSQRMEIVERQFFSELENEKWRQSQDDFIDGSVISKTKSRGAHHLLVGQITQTDVSHSRNSDGSTTYSCDLKAAVRIIDIETSQVVISDIWQNNGLLDLDAGDSEEKAMGRAVNSLKKDIKKFVEEHWPLKGEVIQLDNSGNILVSLGEADGISKGERLIVYTESVLQTGQVFIKEIGNLRVIEVNGSEVCTTKIIKGKNDIHQAIADKVKLYVKTE